MKEKMKKNKYKILIIILLLTELLTYLIEPFINSQIDLITALLIMIVIIFFLIYNRENPSIDNYVILFFIIGIILKNSYVIKTPIYLRGHDIGNIDEDGHLAYIYTLYKTGHLPLTNEWQFYHPPLFHIIGALFLKISDLLKINLNNAIEGIQYINVFFSNLIIYYAYKITKEIKFNKSSIIIILLFITFYPTFYLLAGSINNDCLLLLLEFIVTYYLIIWDKQPNIKNTILLGLFTGLAVMTKANGAIMAIPILYIFIKKIIKNIKNKEVKEIKNIINKIFLFGIISLPIGLWFQIRNIIKFQNISVPYLGTDNWLYLGNYTFAQRFLDISFSQIFDKVFCQLDPNIFAFIVKSSIFGEYTYNLSTTFCRIFLLLNLILIIISLIYTAKYIIKKNKKISLNIILIIWLTTMISFYIFNIKYPFACSQDYRYIAITSFCGICFIEKEIPSKIRSKIEILIFIFSALSSFFIIKI